MAADSILQQAIAEAAATAQSLGKLAGPIEAAARLLEDCLRSGHKLLVCGNGGSASDGAHFVTEFVARFTDNRRPYPAICLTGDGGLLTALGNDYGFEEIFARQVTAFAQPGDVLVVFTTSGRSRNVQRALEQAAAQSIRSVAFLGRDGGPTRGMATVDLCVAAPSTARIQEAHKLLLHVLCEILETRLPRA